MLAYSRRLSGGCRTPASRNAKIVSASFLGTFLIGIVGTEACDSARDPLAPTEAALHSVQPPRTVRFAVIGDYGEAGAAAADVANLVKSWNPDHIVTVGDNNYDDGEASTIDANIGQYYHSFIYPYTGTYGEGAATNRFWPSPGNHDYHVKGAQPYFDYFALPGNERYYDYRDGPVHFFAVNSNRQEPDGNTSTSIQANWLRSALAASTAPWKVVFFHHAPYSSSKHGNQTVMQWPFQDWGADIVLSGHDHTYERFSVNGLPYVVNGLGGRRNTYSFKKVEPGSLVRYNADHGAQLVEADDVSMTARFYTRSGQLIDSITMSKTSFQNGALPTSSYSGNIDTYISQHDTLTNYGQAATLVVDGSDPADLDKRAFLRWDVSAIPSTATVTSVSITLNVKDVSSQTYEVYRVKRNWKEHGATWIHYAADAPWIKPGAGDADDRHAKVLARITGSAVGPVTVPLNSAGVAVVQGWINGTTSNRGVMIMDDENTNGLKLVSSEASAVMDRPRLTITYH